MAKPNLLALLSIDSYTCRESITGAAMQLRAAGINVERWELEFALREARASQCPVTGMYKVPGHVRPFAFDNVQDDLMEAAGIPFSKMGPPWQVVMGHLRLRWAKGDYNRPNPATMIRWITKAGLMPAPARLAA